MQMDIKTRRIVSAISIALAAGGIFLVSSIQASLPPLMTGILVAVCGLAAVGSLMVWYREEVAAGRRK